MNTCQAGHADHLTRIIEVNPWPGRTLHMKVYEPEEYRDTAGYCTGDDVLSRTLILDGMWEKWNTEALLRREVFQGNTVIDVGAHIGWYSLLAAAKGCNVTAFEGDPENASLLDESAKLNGLDDQIFTYVQWVQEDWHLARATHSPPTVDLIKVDIEGNDASAINGLWEIIKAGDVSNLLVEISPVFRDGYPELVQRICEEGYNATVMGQKEFKLPSYKWVEDCHQADILFTR